MKRVLALLLVGIALLPLAAQAAATTGCFCYYVAASGIQYCASSGVTINSAYCEADCAAFYNGTEANPGDGINVPDLTTYTTTESQTTFESELCADNAEPAQAMASSGSAPTLSPLLTPQLEIPIPDLSFAKAVADSNVVTSNFIGEYISGVYKYLIGFAISVAIVMMMIGGLQYVIGASTGEIGKAKDRIRNAVVGLVLLLSVYVILFTVNPQTTLFPALELTYIAEIPTENFFEPTDANAVACTAAGADLRNVNSFQDCMLSNFGTSESEVQTKLVDVKYKSRTYKVHSLIMADFKAALAAIDASGVSYDITTDSSGGTFNWRCNKNYPTAVSAHAWGTAIDVNPATNPNCPPGCTDGNTATACSCVGGTASQSCETMCKAAKPYDIPKEVIDAFVNNGFSWGGNYRKTKDYMHFTHVKICSGG